MDYLGARPEQADPLARVLDPAPLESLSPQSSARPRVLRSISNTGSLDGPDSAPPSTLKSACRPLSESLSLAVRALAVGSPRQADGVAQYLATGHQLRTSQQGALGLRASQQGAMGLRASQQGPLSAPAQKVAPSQSQEQGQKRSGRARSSFLQRAPAAVEDLFMLSR